MDDFNLMSNGNGELRNVDDDAIRMRSQSVVFSKSDTQRDIVEKSVA